MRRATGESHGAAGTPLQAPNNKGLIRCLTPEELETRAISSYNAPSRFARDVGGRDTTSRKVEFVGAMVEYGSEVEHQVF